MHMYSICSVSGLLFEFRIWKFKGNKIFAMQSAFYTNGKIKASVFLSDISSLILLFCRSIFVKFGTIKIYWNSVIINNILDQYTCTINYAQKIEKDWGVINANNR